MVQLVTYPLLATGMDCIYYEMEKIPNRIKKSGVRYTRTLANCQLNAIALISHFPEIYALPIIPRFPCRPAKKSIEKKVIVLLLKDFEKGREEYILCLICHDMPRKARVK